MRECIVCGTAFQPNKHNHKICSNECRLERQRRKHRIPKEQHKRWEKVCVVCEESFSAAKGVQKTCSEECRKVRRKRVQRRNNAAYYHDNKEREAARSKAWRQANPEKVKAARKAWDQNNRERLRTVKAAWVANRTPEQLAEMREKKRAYHQRPEVKARRKQYDATPERRKAKREADKRWHRSEKGQAFAERHQSTPKYILTNRTRASVHHHLRKQGLLKTHKTFDILGYTPTQLMHHLESWFTEGMSWDNMGEWHIDHIRPVSSFTFDSMDDPEFKACWALENLQPLWAFDNMSKGAKWNGE